MFKKYRDADCIVTINGPDKTWIKDDKYHRLDGPAVEFGDGTKWWYRNGERHRDDGPAVIRSDGKKFWFFDDIRINCNSQEEFERLIRLKAFW